MHSYVFCITYINVSILQKGYLVGTSFLALSSHCASLHCEEGPQLDEVNTL